MNARALLSATLRRVGAAILPLAAACVAVSCWAAPAGAVVVDMNALGQSQVAYDPAQAGTYLGINPVPGTTASDLGMAGVPTVQLPTTHFPMGVAPGCADPWLDGTLGGPDFRIKSGGNNPLCWHHGGGVMYGNETFALTWDPTRHYWSSTRNFLEDFLRHVANGSGARDNPYAITTQYRGGSAKLNAAAYDSLYGGGCIDYGQVGGASCRFTNALTTSIGQNVSSRGQDYPSCPTAGGFSGPSALCTVTDTDIRREIATTINATELNGHTATGFTPVIVVLLPDDVNACLDAADTVCSANGSGSTQFCSYHGSIAVGGSVYSYVVQPWTAGTRCDESIAADPDTAHYDGELMVSPLSASHISAIVNPDMSGWYAVDGSEMGDNGCGPSDDVTDQTKIDGATYVMQPAFNNAGVLEEDPTTPTCAHGVVLAATFVPPSPIPAGDQVWFDGSVTASTLMVASTRKYIWNFGDGWSGRGPSVMHEYDQSGAYTVTLSVTDRGGNVSTTSRRVQVTNAVSSGGRAVGPALDARVSLPQQTLAHVARSGIMLRVTSSAPADGIATVTIPRAAAKRAHLRVGRGLAVRVGLGTVTGIRNGSVTVHLHLAPLTAKKLARLQHLSLTVRLQLVGSGGRRVAVDIAGRL